MRLLGAILDILLWLLCGGAVVFDAWSLSRIIRVRRGRRIQSGIVFATIPVYWTRIAFLTLPWTTRLIWIRIAEMLGFLVVYIVVMFGIPSLLPRRPPEHTPTQDSTHRS
jgi:hypothetical protein